MTTKGMYKFIVDVLSYMLHLNIECKRVEHLSFPGAPARARPVK